MTEIRKKTLPKYFREILEGRRRFDIRLADFNIKEGDVLVLEEFDPTKNEFTGRVIKKTVKFITKFNPLEYHDIDEIKKYGFYGVGI